CCTAATGASRWVVSGRARPGRGWPGGARQHVVLYELGAGPANAGITWLTVADPQGILTPEAVEAAASAADHHQPRPVMVAVEDTHMASGGRVWPAGALATLATVATRRSLHMHLDGARLWHAQAATGRSMAELAAPATTVMCCLSKGLGAPVGSLLAGPSDLMAEAVVERQRLGGAMRQAGVIAAAGLVAMRTMRDRLAEDHAQARRLAEAVASRWPGALVGPVETNIVVFEHPEPARLLSHLSGHGVQAGTIAPGVVRLVTHYDVDEGGIELACKALASSPA
ncbi:MAG: threonine aldolase family protein, partial [Acidimicrobiales bacterium]